jgi:hypothetical protein
VSRTGLPYRDMWRRALNAGVGGQNPAVTSTWKLDHLWRASVLQHRADESLQMLEEAMNAGDHPDTVAHFARQFEADCAECHSVFAEGERKHAAA